MVKDPTYVTCTHCGWVHFAVTRKYAINQVIEFNKFYDTLDKEGKASYGDGASMRTYEGCNFCGEAQFRAFEEGDCPRGCTIGPVIADVPITPSERVPGELWDYIDSLAKTDKPTS